MVQGQWHDMTWEMSSDHIRTMEDMDYERELDVEKNEDSEGQPPSQTVRLKPDKITISYTVARPAGVDPRDEIESWYHRMSAGVHAPLFIQGRHIFGQEYLLTKVHFTKGTGLMDAGGRINAGTIEVTFEEYFEEGGGLKNNDGHVISLNPGIRDPGFGANLDSALYAGAVERARQRGQTL